MTIPRKAIASPSTRPASVPDFQAQKKFPKRVSNCEILPIDIAPGKAEILKFLAKYCPDHDNG